MISILKHNDHRSHIVFLEHWPLQWTQSVLTKTARSLKTRCEPQYSLDVGHGLLNRNNKEEEAHLYNLVQNTSTLSHIYVYRPTCRNNFPVLSQINSTRTLRVYLVAVSSLAHKRPLLRQHKRLRVKLRAKRIRSGPRSSM